MNKKQLLNRLLILKIGLLILLVNCNDTSLKDIIASGEQAPKPQETKVAVRGYLLREQIITNSLERPGFIGYKTKVNVMSPHNEIILNMRKEEGDKVRKNEPLFNLDETSLRIEEEQYLAGVKQTEREVEIKKVQYENALLEAEKSILSLERYMKEIELDEINLENQRRIMSNKKKLLDSQGLAQETFIDVQLTYLNAKENLEIKRKDYEINQIGYRDQDIFNEGLSLPTNRNDKIETLKKINTKIELAAWNREITALENAKSRLKSIRYLLSLCKVVSPINGYVASKGFEQGEKADPTRPVYILVNTDEVSVELEVPESYYAEFRLGDPITFIVDASPLQGQTELQSTIASINPVINPQTSTFQIKGYYRNIKSSLRPGMFIKLYWKNSRGETGLFIRQEDLLSFDYFGNNASSMGEVFIVVGERLVKKKVQLGKKIKNYYKVIQGIREGDAIVINESQILKEDQWVDLVLSGFDVDE